MKRGEIYFIQRTYREEGSEQRADRPGVIVSNDKNNESSPTVEVVYLTTRPKKDLPTHVVTRSSGLPSTVLCEQVNTISKARVGEWIGTLTESELAAVDAALAISLGIEQRTAPTVRELTDEEVAELLAEKMKLQPVEIFRGGTDTLQDPTIIKLETERDLYRKMYNELLDSVMKGAG